MKTNAELEAELKTVEAEIDRQYWIFTHTSSNNVKPVNHELYVKKNKILSQINDRKSDGVVITRPVLANESKIEEAVIASANKVMRRMAKYGWTFEQSYAHANLSRHLFRFVK